MEENRIKNNSSTEADKLKKAKIISAISKISSDNNICSNSYNTCCETLKEDTTTSSLLHESEKNVNSIHLDNLEFPKKIRNNKIINKAKNFINEKQEKNKNLIQFSPISTISFEENHEKLSNKVINQNEFSTIKNNKDINNIVTNDSSLNMNLSNTLLNMNEDFVKDLYKSNDELRVLDKYKTNNILKVNLDRNLKLSDIPYLSRGNTPIKNSIYFEENKNNLEDSQSPLYKIKKSHNIEKLHDKFKDEFTKFVKKHRFSTIMIGTKKFESKSGEEYLKTIDDLVKLQRLKRNSLAINKEKENIINEKRRQPHLTPIPTKRRWKGFKFERDEYFNAERTAVIMRRIEYSTNIIKQRNSIRDLEELYLRMYCDQRIIKIQRWYRRIYRARKELTSALIIQRNFRIFFYKNYKKLKLKGKIIKYVKEYLYYDKRNIFNSLLLKSKQIYQFIRMKNLFSKHKQNNMRYIFDSLHSRSKRHKYMYIFRDLIKKKINENLRNLYNNLSSKITNSSKNKRELTLNKGLENIKLNELKHYESLIIYVVLIQKKIREFIKKLKKRNLGFVTKLIRIYKKHLSLCLRIIKNNDEPTRLATLIQALIRGFLSRLPKNTLIKNKYKDPIILIYLKHKYTKRYFKIKTFLLDFIKNLYFRLKVRKFKEISNIFVEKITLINLKNILNKVNDASFEISKRKSFLKYRNKKLLSMYPIYLSKFKKKHFDIWLKKYRKNRRLSLLGISVYQKIFRNLFWRRLMININNFSNLYLGFNKEKIMISPNMLLRSGKQNEVELNHSNYNKLFILTIKIYITLNGYLNNIKKETFAKIFLRRNLIKKYNLFLLIIHNIFSSQIIFNKLIFITKAFSVSKKRKLSKENLLIRKKLKIITLLKKKKLQNFYLLNKNLKLWSYYTKKYILNEAATKIQFYLRKICKYKKLRKLLSMKTQNCKIKVSIYYKHWKRTVIFSKQIHKSNLVSIYLRELKRRKIAISKLGEFLRNNIVKYFCVIALKIISGKRV